MTIKFLKIHRIENDTNYTADPGDQNNKKLSNYIAAYNQNVSELKSSMAQNVFNIFITWIIISRMDICN